jgi:hypothetical protein
LSGCNRNGTAVPNMGRETHSDDGRTEQLL